MDIKVGDWIESLTSEEGVLKGGRYQIIDTNELHPAAGFIDEDGDKNSLWEGQFILCEPPTKQLCVGEEYTSRNGNKWKAIYEEGSKVWMKQLHGGPAYSWNKNGEASCLGEGFYNVNLDKQGPVVVEGVDLERLGGVIDTGHSFNLSFSQHKATVTTIDGEPDWTTLKVVEVES